MGIMATVLERRGVSDAGTLAKPSSWLSDWFGGGGKSKSGMLVNEGSALSISTVWACARALAEDCAKLPLKVYQRQADGSKIVKPDHPVSRLLNLRPNPETTAFLLRETTIAHAALGGNGIMEIEQSGSGAPINLWPIHPVRVTVKRGPNKQIVYCVTGSKGSDVELPASRVFHLRGLGGDGLVGYSVVAKARESMGMAMAAEQFGAAFFGSSARPSGIFTHPGKLDAIARDNLGKSLKEQYSGTDNVAKTMLLWEGLSWTQTMIPPEEAQFLETRQFQVTEICRWFRMKPHKVADLSRATFSNIEQQDLEYVGDCLMGWLVRWEQEANLKLLSEAERQAGYFVEHVVAGLLRGDMKSRMESYQIGRFMGIYSANDVCKIENLNPLPAEIGDQYLVPANMTTPQKLGAAPAPAIAPPANRAANPAPDPNADPAAKRASELAAHERTIRGVATAQEPVLAETFSRVLKVEADKANRARKQGNLAQWSMEFYVGHVDHVRGAVMATVESIDRAVRAATGLTPGKPGWISAASLEIATRHVAVSKEQIADASAFDATIAAWNSARSETQASECAAALSELARAAFSPVTTTTTKEPSP